jgi:hypothetical protein
MLEIYYNKLLKNFTAELQAASETGRGQTEPLGDKPSGMWSCRTWVLPNPPTRSGLECPTLEGDTEEVVY